jgi:hypothetical protein
MYKDVHCESSAQGCLDLPSLALDTRFPAGMTMIVYNDGQGAPESFAGSQWERAPPRAKPEPQGGGEQSRLQGCGLPSMAPGFRHSLPERRRSVTAKSGPGSGLKIRELIIAILSEIFRKSSYRQGVPVSRLQGCKLRKPSLISSSLPSCGSDGALGSHRPIRSRRIGQAL